MAEYDCKKPNDTLEIQFSALVSEVLSFVLSFASLL